MIFRCTETDPEEERNSRVCVCNFFTFGPAEQAWKIPQYVLSLDFGVEEFFAGTISHKKKIWKILSWLSLGSRLCVDRKNLPFVLENYLCCCCWVVTRRTPKRISALALAGKHERHEKYWDKAAAAAEKFELFNSSSSLCHAEKHYFFLHRIKI